MVYGISWDIDLLHDALGGKGGRHFIPLLLVSMVHTSPKWYESVVDRFVAWVES